MGHGVTRLERDGSHDWVTLAEEFEVPRSDLMGEADILTARFRGVHHRGPQLVARLDEAVDIEAALTWARARADDVLVSVGYPTVQYSAGPKGARSAPGWPPPFSITRRRVPGFEWQDRTAVSEPIAWDILVELLPLGDRDEGALADQLDQLRSDLGENRELARRVVDPTRDEGDLLPDLGDRVMLLEPCCRDQPETWTLDRYRFSARSVAPSARQALHEIVREYSRPGVWIVLAAARPA